MNPPVIHTWTQVSAARIEAYPLSVGTAIGFSERCPEKQSTNEDAAGLFVIADGSVILAVADGMGGANCGDRASQAIIETLGEKLQSIEQSEQVRGAVLDAIEVANEQILNWGIGAGSTLAVAVFSDGNMRAYHVGDAMVLLCSNRGRVKYSTVAHSPVAMAVEIGMLNESEAMHHEDRNIISNCIGARDMRIEIGPAIKMSLNDTLIVGSDGLFDNLYQQEIVELIRGKQLEKRIGQLLKVARDRMHAVVADHPTKPDDLTVLCFRQSRSG